MTLSRGFHKRARGEKRATRSTTRQKESQSARAQKTREHTHKKALETTVLVQCLDIPDRELDVLQLGEARATGRSRGALGNGEECSAAKDVDGEVEFAGVGLPRTAGLGHRVGDIVTGCAHGDGDDGRVAGTLEERCEGVGAGRHVGQGARADRKGEV